MTRRPGSRLAVSAGEALLTALYERWTSRFGVDILVKRRAEHAHIGDINVGERASETDEQSPLLV